MKTTEVSTRDYEFAHGKKPRGTGLWMFKLGVQDFQYNGSYGDAKKAALEQVNNSILRGVAIVKVMP